MLNRNLGLALKLVTPVILIALFGIAGCGENQEVLLNVPGLEPAASGPAVSRPLGDFLATQGTVCWPDGGGGCFLFNPPLPVYMFWYDPDNNLGLWPDYAGVAADWIYDESGGAISLGTEITGTIKERPLADGRALVLVNLHVRDACIWGFDFNVGFDPMLGSMPQQVVYEGATPSLGEVELLLKFINTAPGAPLPDWVQLVFFPEPGQDSLFSRVNCYLEAPLTEASGYPEGLPGVGHMAQVNVGALPPNHPNWDGWPVENVFIGPATDWSEMGEIQESTRH